MLLKLNFIVTNKIITNTFINSDKNKILQI